MTESSGKAAGRGKAAGKGKAARKGKAAAKRPNESPASAKKPARVLPDLDQVEGWIDLKVDGVGDRSLGRVVGIHVDATDGLPRWAVVRLGPFAGTTGIPVEHLAEGSRRLFAAYPRSLVRSAVRFGPEEELTAADERELCESLEMPSDSGRAAELGRRRSGTVTARPAFGQDRTDGD